jgi:hypothetical protein
MDDGIKKILPIRENRDMIIKSADELNSIQNMFHGLENKSFLSANPFEYKETEKFGIIVFGKGGSTVTNNTLEYNKLSTFDLGEGGRNQKIINFFQDNQCFIDEPCEELKFPEELEGFKSILNGTSKKDLLIVIRNPIKKWLSGLIQELGKELESSMIASSFLSEANRININSLDDIYKSEHISEEEKSTIYAELSHKFLKMAIFRHGTSQIDHMKLYNESLFLFLNNNKLDLSKIRIIDLDSENSDLVEVFKKYYPDLKTNDNIDNFWSHRKLWDIFSNKLSYTLKNNDNGIYQIIKNEIERELYYYELILKKYKDNIYKN